MRTFLAWTLRVTIWPTNSLPDFLKVPMVAMVVLLDLCFEPAPLRPRWRSAGRRRSTPHLLAGRSAAEDGGRETFLFREEWAQPGEESRPAPLRHRRSRRSRPAARSAHQRGRMERSIRQRRPRRTWRLHHATEGDGGVGARRSSRVEATGRINAPDE